MAGFKSTYLANLWTNWLYNKGTLPTLPTSMFFALFTVAPTAAGTGGTEVSGGGYARVAVARTTTNFPTTTTQSMANATAINWPTSTASWGTVVGVGLYDATTGGNLLEYGPLTAPVAVPSGVVFTLPSSTGMNTTES